MQKKRRRKSHAWAPLRHENENKIGTVEQKMEEMIEQETE
jgi:hypothetical protein